MDCKRFRKYVGAFADGELEVQQNLEVLDHLKMCPECVARVDEVAMLKKSLRKTFDDARAPAELSEKINAACDSTVVPEPTRKVLRADERGSILFRFGFPLGMAAAFLLVFTISQSEPQSVPQLGTITVVKGRVVADVLEQHRFCVDARGLLHHNRALPRELEPLAKRLSKHLKLNVLVPDLASRGFRLIGADYCGIRGRRGAHVLYRSTDTAGLLSIFTTRFLPEIGTGELPDPSELRFFVSSSEMPVVVWHQEHQTFAICGNLVADELLEIAKGVRLASMGPSGTILAAAHLFSSPSRRDY